MSEKSFQKGGLAGGASLIKEEFLPELLPNHTPTSKTVQKGGVKHEH